MKSLKDKVKSKNKKDRHYKRRSNESGNHGRDGAKKKTATMRDGQMSQAATAETTPSNWIERTAFWMGSICTRKLYRSVVT